MGLPIPDLDDKTFDELIEESRLRIARYAPEWTDHNVHDPGITFMELFAWLAEMQIYQLDQVTDTHYKKFLQLVGLSPFAAKPARAEITFDKVTSDMTIAAGTKIIAEADGESLVFETSRELKLTEQSLENLKSAGVPKDVLSSLKMIQNQVFTDKENFLNILKLTIGSRQTDIYKTVILKQAEIKEDFTLVPAYLKKILIKYDSRVIDNTIANVKEDIYFTPFGDNAPPGAELQLGFNAALPRGEEIQLTFELVEKDLPPATGSKIEPLPVSPSVKLIWEYWNGGKWNVMTIKNDTTISLAKSGKLVFTAPAAMDKKSECYWIRCRIERGRYEIIPLINHIKLNTVSAVQVETIINETLETGRGIPDQVVLLNKAPVIKGSQTIQLQGEDSQWQDWQEVESFEQSEPNDHHYLFDATKGEITFGNGFNGCIPFKSQKICAAIYQTTAGFKGNLPAGMDWRIKIKKNLAANCDEQVNETGWENIKGINLQPASGGKAAETVKHACARAKKDFRTLYRAVTSTDYEQLALATPGLRVARAKAIPGYHPDYPCISMPGAVTVTVVPYIRKDNEPPVPGDGFLQTVLRHLNEHRLITTDVHVTGPLYVKISVSGKVHVKKKSSPIEVEKRAQKALKAFLDPLNGGVDGKGWLFGRPVYLSEIYQVIDEAEGVDYVTNVTLAAEGQYQQVKGIIKIPPDALVCSGEHRLQMK